MSESHGFFKTAEWQKLERAQWMYFTPDVQFNVMRAPRFYHRWAQRLILGITWKRIKTSETRG